MKIYLLVQLYHQNAWNKRKHESLIKSCFSNKEAVEAFKDETENVETEEIDFDEPEYDSGEYLLAIVNVEVTEHEDFYEAKEVSFSGRLLEDYTLESGKEFFTSIAEFAKSIRVYARPGSQAGYYLFNEHSEV